MSCYVRWQWEGHLSSTGACFDTGGTVSSARSRFEVTGESFSGSTDPHAAIASCSFKDKESPEIKGSGYFGHQRFLMGKFVPDFMDTLIRTKNLPAFHVRYLQ